MIFIETYSTESRCVIGAENIRLQAHQCIFQPGQFIGCGSKEVNMTTQNMWEFSGGGGGGGVGSFFKAIKQQLKNS